MDYKKYFQHYDAYFWKRDLHFFSPDDYSFVYETPQKSTIAYSDFVISILDHLAIHSVPPLGSLLLAIAATNEEPKALMDEMRQIAQSFRNDNANPNSNLFGIDAAFDFLGVLTALPAIYKTGSKRIQVFQVIFEQCHNRISGEKFKRLMQEYKLHEADFLNDNPSLPFNKANFVKDFRTLGLLKLQFQSPQAIIQAMENLPDTATIMDELDGQITDSVNISENPKDYIDQLIDHNKTFHVGALIKRIWSGIRIPLHHNQPSDQPLGGIADITNKGDFNHLLLSEFANEDVVFMSRIANNEALYIEREIPPQDDKFIRDLLIDSTLKNWGNPKVVGFAAALAIAKHPKTDVECDVYVLGEQCEKISYQSVNDVIDGLELISPVTSCAEGLVDYFRQSEANFRERETYLILAEESLKQESFQKVLHENYQSLHFILTTSAQGAINFYKVANSGRKLVQKMTLDLEELWKRKKQQPKGKPQAKETEPEGPLLYPLERNYQDIFHYNSVFYTFSRGSLYAFDEEGFTKGFVKIASGIPDRNGVFALFENNRKELVLVNISENTGILSLYNTVTKEEVITTREEKYGSNPYLFCHNGEVYARDSFIFGRIHPENGILIKTESDVMLQAFKDYQKMIDHFAQNYVMDRKKYSVIRKNEANILIDTYWQVVEINGLILLEDTFRKRSHFADTRYEIEARADLILKRVGTNRVETIQLLMSHLNISLGEAKMLSEEEHAVLLEDVPYHEAERVKKEIEKSGTVCYIRCNYYQAPDGSIIRNKDGILEFESSSKMIPKFYIPFVINRKTAMATDHEFAGNEYFLPKENSLTVISVESFHTKYITPFVIQIIENGIKA